MIVIVDRDTKHPDGLVWSQVSRDFDRSECGRFDLFYSKPRDAWCAVDSDTGTVYRSHSRFDAESWCARRFTAPASDATTEPQVTTTKSSTQRRTRSKKHNKAPVGPVSAQVLQALASGPLRLSEVSAAVGTKRKLTAIVLYRLRQSGHVYAEWAKESVRQAPGRRAVLWASTNWWVSNNTPCLKGACYVAMKRTGVPAEELFGAAVLSVYTAAARYKPDRGAQFRTFAQMVSKLAALEEAKRIAAGGLHVPRDLIWRHQPKPTEKLENIEVPAPVPESDDSSEIWTLVSRTCRPRAALWVVAHYKHGLAMTKIAEHNGVSLATVSLVISSALELIRTSKAADVFRYK